MDNPLRIAARTALAESLSHLPLQNAQMQLIDNMYRIPRLIVKVRQLSWQPTNHTLLQSTLTLAKEMYDPKHKRAQKHSMQPRFR